MIHPSLKRVVGQSKSTSCLRKELTRVAGRVGGVYLYGELGVGKELCARTVHELSARREGPFKIVDCARFFPEDLCEILFGSEKRPAASLLSRCDGGTMYMVHPEEMVMEVQERLLSFLQTGAFTLGTGSQKRLSDVRLVLGTEKNLQVYVEGGMLLKGIWDYCQDSRLSIPPLRERMADIDGIIEALMGAPAVTRFDPDVLAVFQQYAWPGNYEELIEEVARLIRTGHHRIDVEHVRRDIVNYDKQSISADPDIREVLQEIEQCIQAFHVSEESPLDFAPYFWRGGPVPGASASQSDSAYDHDYEYDTDNETWEQDLAW